MEYVRVKLYGICPCKALWNGPLWCVMRLIRLAILTLVEDEAHPLGQVGRENDQKNCSKTIENLI